MNGSIFDAQLGGNVSIAKAIKADPLPDGLVPWAQPMRVA